MINAALLMMTPLGMPPRNQVTMTQVIKGIQFIEEVSPVDVVKLAEERKQIIELSKLAKEKLFPALDEATLAILKNYEDMPAFAARVERVGPGPEGVTLFDAVNMLCIFIRSANQDLVRRLDVFKNDIMLANVGAIDSEAVDATSTLKLAVAKVQRYLEESAQLLAQVSVSNVAQVGSFVTDDQVNALSEIGDNHFKTLAS